MCNALGLDWIGLELDWIGLDWIGLDWIGLDWIGLDWIGLDWIGLEWNWIAVDASIGWVVWIFSSHVPLLSTVDTPDCAFLFMKRFEISKTEANCWTWGTE